LLAPAALLRLDVRRPYHLAPFLGFVGDKLAEFGGCHRQRLSVQIGETRPQLGFDNGRIGFLVEPLDDFRGRFPRRADTVPRDRLVPRQKFAYGWNIWQRIRTCAGGHRQRTKITGPDVLNCRRHRGEHYLHLPGQQIGQRGRCAAIGNVEHIDTSQHFEKITGYVSPTTVTLGTHGDFARISFGIGTEYSNVLRRKRRRHHHNIRHAADTGNRHDVTDEVVIELLIERRVGRIRMGGQEERITVRGRTRDELGADIAGRTSPVFYDEWLTQP